MSVISLNSAVRCVIDKVQRSNRAITITVSNQHQGGEPVQRVMTPENQNKVEGVVYDALEILSQDALERGKRFYSLEVRAKFLEGGDVSTATQEIIF